MFIFPLEPISIVLVVKARVVLELLHHHWIEWTNCIIKIGQSGQEEVPL